LHPLEKRSEQTAAQRLGLRLRHDAPRREDTSDTIVTDAARAAVVA
jgi:hypothetical protein